MWSVRLGTFPTNRDEAIHILEWAVAILFVLILVLAAVHFTQMNTRVVLIIVAVVILFFVARLVASARGGGGDEHTEH